MSGSGKLRPDQSDLDSCTIITRSMSLKPQAKLHSPESHRASNASSTTGQFRSHK